MSSFPKKKKKYQKVPLGPVGEEDLHSLQLATLPSSSASTLPDLPDDVKVDLSLSPPLPPQRAYAVLSAACSQLLKHHRLAVVLKRARLVVDGYRRKRDERMPPFTVRSLASLASTVVDEEHDVSLMDYLVKQVYTEDLPTDPHVTSVSAPSVLSSLTLLWRASVTPLPLPSSPPDPLHEPTAALLQSTVDFLFPQEAGQVEWGECLRLLCAFMEEFKHSERSLGLKEADREEVVEDLEGWLEGTEAEAGEDLVEEDEGETMKMTDFLGEDVKIEEGDEEDEEEEDDGVGLGMSGEVRVDVRGGGKRGGVEDEDDDLDEVKLDDLKLDDDDDDEEDEHDGLRRPPGRGPR